MKKIAVYISFILFLSVPSVTVSAAEPADPGPGLKIYHATNMGGLTGLFYTNSAYTLPEGHFEIGTGVLFEKSATPYYSMIQIPINVTYGLSNTIEFGLASKMARFTGIGLGIGDIEINGKWRVKEQSKLREGVYLPAIAFGVGLILPTGSSGFNDVNNWGAKAMFMVTSEGTLSSNLTIGAYLDAQVVVKDPGSTSPFRDNYLVLNLGALLPWREDKDFQFIGEINMVNAKDSVNLGSASYNGVTLGARYVPDNVKLSTSLQFINKLNAGYGDAFRITVMASVEF